MLPKPCYWLIQSVGLVPSKKDVEDASYQLIGLSNFDANEKTIGKAVDKRDSIERLLRIKEF